MMGTMVGVIVHVLYDARVWSHRRWQRFFGLHCAVGVIVAWVVHIGSKSSSIYGSGGQAGERNEPNSGFAQRMSVMRRLMNS